MTLGASRKSDERERPGGNSRPAGRLVSLRVLVTLLLLAQAAELAANGPSIDARREANVKAVFLYSFGRYVQWPQQPKKQFVIGVLGEVSEHFAQAIHRVAATRTIDRKLITVRRFEAVDEVQDCQILFVTDSISEEEQNALLESHKTRPVLLVGESPGFAQRGGVINFYLNGSTVRFEINGEAAHRRKLKLDAKLLNLGRPVQPK